METLLGSIKKTVRGIMFEVAKILDGLTNGAIKPEHVTYLSLAGHIVLAFAIADGRFAESAMLLVIFGLMDALDGALARYQDSATVQGVVLDATSDRIKEAMIYTGIAYWFSTQSDNVGVVYAVIALGISFAVSYVKAKGETALLETNPDTRKEPVEINRRFGIGMFGYEVRMFVLVVGFLTTELRLAVAFVIAGATLTFIVRAIEVKKSLQ